MSERLHKRIAASGICSRRAAEELIKAGRVAVNGDPVIQMGVIVTDDDIVTVDGEPIGRPPLYVLVMHKPTGYVTTLSDPQGRPTVKRLLPAIGAALKPVGRLDMNSEGLLLFTNDGELSNRLVHPRWGMEKEYEVTVEGVPSMEDLDRLRKGIYIDGGKTRPAVVELLSKPDRKATTSKLKFILHEGKKRQIRLMCDAIRCPVVKLVRVRIGFLRLKGMPPGQCRMLGKQDIERLAKAVGLDR
ncbi:MAG: rRNA pseudouridine synthase [Methanoregulaceae archaeon]|nr:rRNA pseudouridine synthase [Methanoregulaceae archaeon]